MIAQLTGTLLSKSPTEVIVDVQGVGFVVHIPLSTYEKLGALHSTVRLLTHLHIREDALQLFGFASEEERKLFRLLLSVSGIGPKIALGILSGMSVGELTANILSGNIGAITSIQGVGRKTAERIIVELKDVMAKCEGVSISATGTDSATIRAEALLALQSLGFTQQAAEKAIRNVLVEKGNPQSTEELIKEALRISRSGI